MCCHQLETNFLNSCISNNIKTIHGINDNNEKIIPIRPAEDGIIIKIPERNPQKPRDFLKLGLFSNVNVKSNKAIALTT